VDNGEEMMRMLKLILALSTGTFIALGAGTIEGSAADVAGGCGEYKYYQKGGCKDARDKTGKSWTETMTSRPAW
jgi:hypothetical protein